MSILVKNRPDYLGSNVMPKLALLCWGHYTKEKLIHEGEVKYDKSIVMESFLKMCKAEPGETETEPWDILQMELGMLQTVIKLKRDLPSYFREYRFKEFYRNMLRIAKQRGYPLPQGKKVIVVHVRMGDQSNKKDYDGEEGSKGMRNFINNDELYNPHDNEIPENYQGPISEDKLKKILRVARKENPNHVTKFVSDSPDLLATKYPSLKYEVVRGNEDEDIWAMINSDVLVTGRSNFSLMCGMLHKKNNVYCAMWRTAATMGLSSKYDRSNWRKFY